MHWILRGFTPLRMTGRKLIPALRPDDNIEEDRDDKVKKVQSWQYN